MEKIILVEGPMKRKDLRLFVERWKAVEETETEELRRTPMDVRLRQTAAAMRLGAALNLPSRDEDDPETLEVRRRWVRLKGVQT